MNPRSCQLSVASCQGVESWALRVDRWTFGVRILEHVLRNKAALSMNRAIRVGRDVPIAPLDFVD